MKFSKQARLSVLAVFAFSCNTSSAFVLPSSSVSSGKAVAFLPSNTRGSQHISTIHTVTSLEAKRKKGKGGGGGGGGYNKTSRGQQPQQEKQSVKDAR